MKQLKFSELVALVEAQPDLLCKPINMGTYRTLSYWLSDARQTFVESMMSCKWNIKEEPREFWLNVYPSGDAIGYESELRARKNLSTYYNGTTVHVREVLQ